MEPPLTDEELRYLRARKKADEFDEEAQARISQTASKISKWIIDAGKVAATLAVLAALVKGWVADFVLSILSGGKK